ncbi:MAG TPA: formylglycine-generating enzyme family protein [bacterium]|nr:formylglycine-generating enzyme family protein [bacterium]
MSGTKRHAMILLAAICAAALTAGCSGRDAQKQKPRRANGKPAISDDFALIPAGSFTMGSPQSELGREPDETQFHVVISKGFKIGVKEVTQKQWTEIMGANPSHFKNCGDDCPVENVSWDDVQEFIVRYNEKHGGGYRLPTEAEWEYAARAGASSAFHTGDITEESCASDPALDRAGWHCGNSAADYPGCEMLSAGAQPQCSGVQPAGGKEPNAWGLYDMHGNVYEWTSSWLGPYPTGEAADPAGPDTGRFRVVRGGSWDRPVKYCRVADRRGVRADIRDKSIGFRLARDIK